MEWFHRQCLPREEPRPRRRERPLGGNPQSALQCSSWLHSSTARFRSGWVYHPAFVAPDRPEQLERRQRLAVGRSGQAEPKAIEKPTRQPRQRQTPKNDFAFTPFSSLVTSLTRMIFTAIYLSGYTT